MRHITDTQRSAIADLTASPNTTRQIDSPYLTAKEAVAYLRLGSLRALYRLLDEHQLPHGRRGRIYLFDIRKLDRWIEMGGSGQVEMIGRRKAS